MKLAQLGANRTLIEFANGMEVFFSYKTPVAAWIPGRGVVVTEKKWSVTTSKHIGEYKRRKTGFGNYAAQIEPQDFFDNLTESMT